MLLSPAEIHSTVHYSFRISDWSGLWLFSVMHMMRAIYSASWLYFIHMINLCKPRERMKFVREGNALLVRYSLDEHIRYSTYLLIFKSWKGPSEALNFSYLPQIT